MVIWDRAEEVVFRRRYDLDAMRDVFTVSAAPAVTVVHRAIVEEAERHRLWEGNEAPIAVDRDAHLLRWRFANCRCAYRILEYSPIRDSYLCERLAAMGD